jgi:hypothetical protein
MDGMIPIDFPGLPAPEPRWFDVTATVAYTEEAPDGCSPAGGVASVARLARWRLSVRALRGSEALAWAELFLPQASGATWTVGLSAVQVLSR